MKELNAFRKFLSENALGIDQGDGTFEITPDIEIMGQKFNFSDICPSAHKLVKKVSTEASDSPTVLMFAILHRDFFALEKKALGAVGITVDEYKNDVTRLYTEILNVADKLGVRDEAKEYMDMHIGKIKDAGFKASEPGGSSDYKADNDYYMDETGEANEFLQEQLREVRNRIASEVEGYTDLHENDVALEAFLGEEELEEDKKYADDQLKFKKGDTVYFKNVKGGKNLPMTITGPGKFMKSNRLDAGGKEIVFPVKGGPGGKGMYAADDLVKKDQKKIEEDENLEEGPYGSSQTGYQVQYRTMNDKVASFDSKVFADKNEALTFAKSKESDPSIMGVQVWEFYGPGEKRGNSQYLGGEKEISYYSNPVIRQKDGELSPEELDIKKFMGNPSYIHKRYGLSMDYNLMDTIKAMKSQRQEFLASSNEE